MTNILKTLGITLAFIGMLGIIASTVDIKKFAGLTAQLIQSQTVAFEDCIQTFEKSRETKFTIQSVKINIDSTDDGLISYTEGQHCGTAGCSFELCISHADGTYHHVPFGYVAQSARILDTITQGMHDIMLNDDQSLTMVWNGDAYILESN